MGGTRKTIVAISAGLVSVLIMAGVAAASGGSNDSGRQRPAGIEDSSTSTTASDVSATLGTGVTKSSEPEPATPEHATLAPGDDNGHDAVDNNGNEVGDDNGNDAADDDNTSTTIVDGTSTSTPTSADDHGHDEADDNSGPGSADSGHSGSDDSGHDGADDN